MGRRCVQRRRRVPILKSASMLGTVWVCRLCCSLAGAPDAHLIPILGAAWMVAAAFAELRVGDQARRYAAEWTILGLLQQPVHHPDQPPTRSSLPIAY